MFAYVFGVVTENKNGYVFLEKNDVGYLINVINDKDFTLFNEYKIYLYHYIKDESEIVFYGFLELEEMLFFKKLLLVNGIGPKTAQAILKKCSYKKMIYLIKNNMVDELNSIPGVSSRGSLIINELKNKLKEFNYTLFTYFNVEKALKELGFKDKMISYALEKIEPNLDDSQALKEALRIIKNG